MQPRDFAKDYVTVAARVEAFYKAYPEGSLQSEIVEMTDKRVIVRAVAFRNPEDPRPDIGHSALAIPGATPYTRGSELENAETSAWGRAIAALGFETKAGIASADEVAMRQNGHGAPQTASPAHHTPTNGNGHHEAPAPVPGDGLTLAQAMDALNRAAIDKKAISAKGKELYGTWSLKEMTPAQRAHLVEELLGPDLPPPSEDFSELPF